ncbi:zinc finger protein 420-like [Musca vetustissima]|uniref:zinc finger protein 420-like n=1 Tax=Musca vetustissima TaxID=27455 RepID=UPI002AB644AE|nr:zinc finger protein 420-like [Musca vetustissima]
MDTKRCRICLNSSHRYFDIFDNCKSSFTYADNIRHIAEVDVQQNDGLPQKICGDCSEEIRNIFEFGLLIRHGDEVLRKELRQMKGIHDAEDENIQILEEDCFITEIEHDGEGGGDESMAACVLAEEEVLTVDGELVEEYGSHDENFQIIEEEIFEVVDDIPDVDAPAQQEPLAKDKELSGHLEELAQVAATQQNVLLNKEEMRQDHYADDECDEDYLIPYNPAEEAFYNFKPPKWKCIECKRVLRGDVSYEGHMNIHKQLHPHTCPQCKAEFRCRIALKKHKDKRHNAKQHPNDCQVLDQKQNLDTDISSQSFKCPECQREFVNDADLLLHEISLTHGNRCHLTSCPFCPHIKVDKLIDHLKYFHIRNEEQNDEVEELSNSKLAFQCESCSQTYKTIEELHLHQEQCCNVSASEDHDITVEDDFEENMLESIDAIVYCEVCNKKLLKKNLKRHMLVHQRKDKKTTEDVNKLLCAYCPREFKTSKSLHQHERIHESESAYTIYTCDDCGRQYATQLLLDTHRKQAHKERDHICSICGNAFKLKNQLVNHMKLHLEKNIQCPHCDKKYARQFDLNVHLRSHTGEMPYACHLCSKRFAIKVRLTYHLQKHYGVKHRCKECHAEFNSKQKLKTHSFKHTGMPYRCELCDDHGFSTRVVFKRHLSRVHHSTMSDEALSEMFQRNTGKTIKIKQISSKHEDEF